jgi:hypothetical protein
MVVLKDLEHVRVVGVDSGVEGFPVVGIVSVHFAVDDGHITDLAPLPVLHELRKGNLPVMTHAGALLHDLPEKNQASQDEYPENNCLDRRIHEKTSFYCASREGTIRGGAERFTGNVQLSRLLDDSNLPTIPKTLRCLDTANNRMRAHASISLTYSTPHKAETAAKGTESVPEVIRGGY